MADEVLYSGLGDQRLTEILSTQILLSLADRNWIGNHPALWRAPRLNGTGSLTIKVPIVGLNGYDAMVAPTNEDDSQANVALTDSSKQITIARQSFAREISGSAQITDTGTLTPAAFAADLLGAYNARFTNLLAAMPSGFATSVGSTGVNMAVSDFLAAKAALLAANADDGAPLLTLLHGVQFSDLIAELTTTSGGAAQFAQATQQMIQARGGGYQGSFLGCDIFVSNRVPTANAGADRAGGMWTRGAILWADAAPYVDDPTQQMALGDAILMERDRTARSDRTAWIGHAYLGFVEGIDLRGVKIVTDA